MVRKGKKNRVNKIAVVRLTKDCNAEQKLGLLKPKLGLLIRN